MSRIEAVFLDVGETLIDETRHWGGWADWLGVPRLTFFTALGAVIARGEHHRAVFDLFRPGFDYAAAWRAREAAGYRYEFLPSDFYPDALACLTALRAGGYRIGVAGNQPEACEPALRNAGVTADWIASSTRWGLEKPSPDFFARIAAECGLPASRIAYVGDRMDNDVSPAAAAGMSAIFIQRGPWGFIHPHDGGAAGARIASLAELPALLATFV